MRSTSLGRGRRYARRECNRGRAHHPARQVDGTTTQRECMCGALVRCHDPRGVHHRLAEVLEPSGGIPVTGDAGQDPDARAAMLGQAEAVITSRSGLGTPRCAQRERLGVADGRRDPGRTPSLTSTGRVQGRGGVRPGWLKGGCRRGSARRRPSSIHCGIMLWSAPAAMHSWAAALALGSSSLPSLAPSKMPATSASRSARLPATSRSSVAAAAISGSVGLRQRAGTGAWWSVAAARAWRSRPGGPFDR